MIVIEDLKVASMSKSAAGTTSQPGRNVRAKSGLNRSILDQGWFELRRQLEYKQAWRGGQVLAINPAYTSQQCACCGHTAKDNRQTQSQFKCAACGYEGERRCERRSQYFSGGTRRFSLWRRGAIQAAR